MLIQVPRRDLFCLPGEVAEIRVHLFEMGDKGISGRRVDIQLPQGKGGNEIASFIKHDAEAAYGVSQAVQIGHIRRHDAGRRNIAARDPLKLFRQILDNGSLTLVHGLFSLKIPNN